jgi:hypothetical protein
VQQRCTADLRGDSGGITTVRANGAVTDSPNRARSSPHPAINHLLNHMRHER